MSETFAIDLEYQKNMYLGGENSSLTGALFKYLTDKGITVYKAEAPVIMFEGESILMNTRKCQTDCPMVETFEQIYDHLVENNIDTIFLYKMQVDYRWCKICDESFEEVGEAELREYRTVRYGVRSHE